MTKDGKRPQIINSSKTHTHGTGAEKSWSGFRSAKRQVEQGLRGNQHLDIPPSLGGNTDVYGIGGINLTTTPIKDKMAPEPKDWGVNDIDRYWNSTYKKNTDKQYQDMLDFDSEQDRITEEQNLDSIPGMSRGTDTFFNQMWDSALSDNYPYNALAQRWLSGNMDAATPYGPPDFKGFEYSYMWENPNLINGKNRFGAKNADGATVTNTPIVGSPLMETNLDKTRPGWYPGMGNNGYLASSEPIPSNAGDIYNVKQTARGVTSALSDILAHAGQTGRSGIPINSIQEKTMSQEDYQDAKNNAAQDRATVINTPVASVTNTPLSSFASNGAGYISMPSVDNMSPEDYERYQATLANANASSAANAKDKNTVAMNWGQPKSKQNINFDWDGDGSSDLDNTSHIGQVLQLSKPSSSSDAADTDSNETSEQEAGQIDYEKYGGEDAYKMASNKNKGAKYILSNLMSGASGGLLKTGATSPQELAGMARYAYKTTGTEGARDTLAQAQTRANRDEAQDLRRQYNEALMGRSFEDELMGSMPEDTPSLSDIEELEKRVTRDDVLRQLGIEPEGMENESLANDINGVADTNGDGELGLADLDATSDERSYEEALVDALVMDFIKQNGLEYTSSSDFQRNALEDEWRKFIYGDDDEIDDDRKWLYEDVINQYDGWDGYWRHFHDEEDDLLNDVAERDWEGIGRRINGDPNVIRDWAVYWTDESNLYPDFDKTAIDALNKTYGMSLKDGSELVAMAQTEPKIRELLYEMNFIYLYNSIMNNDTYYLTADDVASLGK